MTVKPLRIMWTLMVAVIFAVATGQEVVCQADGTCENVDVAVPVPKGANEMGKPREAIRECLDRHEECVGFEQQGECQQNPGWMIINCAKSCNACHLRDPIVRCDRATLNMSINPIYEKHQMQRMFENIENRFGKKYEINIISTDPWVVTFDNFLTDKVLLTHFSEQLKLTSCDLHCFRKSKH